MKQTLKDEFIQIWKNQEKEKEKFVNVKLLVVDDDFPLDSIKTNDKIYLKKSNYEKLEATSKEIGIPIDEMASVILEWAIHNNLFKENEK
jgi:hypothetical protein